MDAVGRDVTKLLLQLGKGDRAAESELIEIVLPHLRRIASSYMRSERPDHTLQATAIVHEAYLRLVRIQDMNWENQAHFFCLAARLMRQILVDHARARNAKKRPRGEISLDKVLVYSNEKPAVDLELDEALSRLANKDPRMARIVELKFFGGLTFDQIGRVLEVSEKTAKRDWQLARAWLQKELRKH